MTKSIVVRKSEYIVRIRSFELSPYQTFTFGVREKVVLLRIAESPV